MNFSRFALPYTWLTDHRAWKRALRQAAKHLPPSGETLRLLDLSCGGGTSLRDLHTLRPDLAPYGLDRAWGMVRLAHKRGLARPVQGDAGRLPFPANSFDAVLIQRTLYFSPQRADFLAEALRVLRGGGRLIVLEPAEGQNPRDALRLWRSGPHSVLDMAVWHAAARRIGGYTPESLARLLDEAGFARVLGEPTLEGLGVLARGEKPYPQGRAGHPMTVGGGQVVTPDSDPSALAGVNYLHLLITQTPDKPAWELTPDDVLIWGAQAVKNAAGQPYLLAFSTLPRVVGFLQRAVTAGKIQGVNKSRKFRPARVLGWGYPLLLNPSLDDLAAFQSPPVLLSIDPAEAEVADE